MDLSEPHSERSDCLLNRHIPGTPETTVYKIYPNVDQEDSFNRLLDCLISGVIFLPTLARP